MDDFGEPLAHGVFVFYPNQTAAQTPATAARCKLLSTPGDATIRLRLEDATEVTVDLTALRVIVTSVPP